MGDQMSGFNEVTETELCEINGGGPLTVVAAVVVIAFLIGVVKGCSDEANK